jgi:hypothetical protein
MPTDAERIKELEARIKLYEQDGAAKLFYAINRKMAEMANLMNKNSLTNLDLDDKDSKAFERIFKLLEKSQIISNAAQTIQGFAGISGDEEKDIQYPRYRITTPESISDVLGHTAGQRS